MKLSTKSWHARLWHLSYGRYRRLPTNGCPYVWSILPAMIFIIPVLLLETPLLITNWAFNRFGKEKDDFDELSDSGLIHPLPILAGLIFNAGLFIVICMICILFTRKKNIMAPAILGWLLTIGLSIFFGIRWLNSRRKKTGVEVEKRPNIFVEFVKAKYNRYCPKITWEDENEKSN